MTEEYHPDPTKASDGLCRLSTTGLVRRVGVFSAVDSKQPVFAPSSGSDLAFLGVWPRVGAFAAGSSTGVVPSHAKSSLTRSHRLEEQFRENSAGKANALFHRRTNHRE